MGYSIRTELTPDRWAVIFECDPQSREALLRDFPWLRSCGRRVRRLSVQRQSSGVLASLRTWLSAFAGPRAGSP
jgi:hypothetical protein